MTKPLTPKREEFFEALLSEAHGHIRAAMDLAGYTRTTKTAEVVGPLKEEITERAGMMLAMNAPKAAFGIVDVLDNPSAMGTRNAIFAAHEVLDRTGLVKKEQGEVQPKQVGCLFYLQKPEMMWHNKIRPNKMARVPYAYIASEEHPLVLIPGPEVTRWVEDAPDHLDEGHSCRRVATWLVENRNTQILKFQQELDFMETLEVCLDHAHAIDFFRRFMMTQLLKLL